jgi:uncharacterized protein (TIGR00255 family)
VLTSMTGQGEGVAQDDDLSVRAELRSTNNRHFKLSLRINDGYNSLETQLERAIKKHVRRGSVHLVVKIDRPASSDELQINEAAVRSLLDQLSTLPGADGIELPILLPALLGLPGVVQNNAATTVDLQKDWPIIESAVSKAASSMCEMRQQEGAAMHANLSENLQQIAELLGKVQARSPEVSISYQERLLERINKILAEHALTVEPADVVREVGLFVDRSDISEETVRLNSHLELFTAEMDLPQAQGRKLDFLTQEMFREANTIGSKANDSQISALVIEIKTCIERMREMIQNVE